MAELSPQAQAVLDGFRAVPSLMDAPSIAGALRAAADQWRNEVREQPNTEFICGIKSCIDALDDIADELKGSKPVN
jgi:hypothetical protein